MLAVPDEETVILRHEQPLGEVDPGGDLEIPQQEHRSRPVAAQAPTEQTHLGGEFDDATSDLRGRLHGGGRRPQLAHLGERGPGPRATL